MHCSWFWGCHGGQHWRFVSVEAPGGSIHSWRRMVFLQILSFKEIFNRLSLTYLLFVIAKCISMSLRVLFPTFCDNALYLVPASVDVLFRHLLFCNLFSINTISRKKRARKICTAAKSVESIVKTVVPAGRRKRFFFFFSLSHPNCPLLPPVSAGQ